MYHYKKMLLFFSPQIPFTIWHQLEGNQPAIGIIEKSVRDYGLLPEEILQNNELCTLLKNAPAKALRWIKTCPPAENRPHHFCPLVHWDETKGEGLILFIPDVPVEQLNSETLFT
jgi:hypothetical protein